MPVNMEQHAGLLDFVTVALKQTELSGICQMLAAATRTMHAWGTFLWQLHEDSRLDTDPPSGRFFVLAEWFPLEKTWAFENLDLNSTCGRAVILGRAQNTPHVLADPNFGRQHRAWFEQHRVDHLCAIPVDFPDAKASLNFYRQEVDPPFSEAEIQLAVQLAGLFPGLYLSIRNLVSFDVLRKIEKKTLENQVFEETAIDDTLRDLCELIGQTFKASECSLFLEHRLKTPGVYRRAATTWPKESPYQTTEYSIDSSEGITPWVLRNAKPVRLSNLAVLESGKEIDSFRYPRMVWQDPLHLIQTASRSRGLPVEELPPLSYMAAPIMAGGTLVGAIRCCAATEPPYHYAERELKLLQVAASDIGRYWDSWMRHLELNAESEAWRKFIDRVRELNETVNTIMAGPLPDEAGIDAQVRTVAEEAGAASMVALLEQQKNLYKVLFQMIRSRKEGEEELQQRAETDRRFYEDLFHQLKSPIFTATATACAALNRERTIEVYRSHLQILRGQLQRAERVTRAVQVFAEFANGRAPKPELAALEMQRLLKLLAWAAADHDRLFAFKGLKFDLDRAGFGNVRKGGVLADLNLVLHAANNLLDNAGKYSYANTTVRIFGGLSGNGRFHISVVNKGLRLKPGEAKECVTRGWRGDEAKMVTGEGSGLGLWIVDQIMAAHNGQVLVQSPNAENEFEVKLLFPYVR